MHTALTIFGATGDLARRKLLPAFYTLEKKKQLEGSIAIFCVSKDSKSHEEDKKEWIIPKKPVYSEWIGN